MLLCKVAWCCMYLRWNVRELFRSFQWSLLRSRHLTSRAFIYCALFGVRNRDNCHVDNTNKIVYRGSITSIFKEPPQTLSQFLLLFFFSTAWAIFKRLTDIELFMWNASLGLQIFFPWFSARPFKARIRLLKVCPRDRSSLLPCSQFERGRKTCSA